MYYNYIFFRNYAHDLFIKDFKFIFRVFNAQ